eukprot:9088425-Pyramimonas_sp.AAC.2
MLTRQPLLHLAGAGVPPRGPPPVRHLCDTCLTPVRHLCDLPGCGPAHVAGAGVSPRGPPTGGARGQHFPRGGARPETGGAAGAGGGVHRGLQALVRHPAAAAPHAGAVPRRRRRRSVSYTRWTTRRTAMPHYTRHV